MKRYRRRSSYWLGDGILFSSWKEMPLEGWKKRWPDFEPWEFASNDNGEAYYHPRTFDAIQMVRDIVRQVVSINSAHRSRIRNMAVGGAPDSAHLFIALDISIKGHNLANLLNALKAAGFKSFGFYNSFIHADMRPGRVWYSDASARKMWQPIYRGEFVDVSL